MSRLKLAFLLAAVAFFVSGTTCFADSLAVTPSGGWTVSGDNTDSFTIGWQFTVNSPVQVTQLGYYGGLGTLLNNHTVGIFNSTGSLVDSAVVPAGGGILQDGFLFVGAPVALGTGSYTIGAASLASNDVFIIQTNSNLTIPQITLGETGLYSFGSSLTLPTSDVPDFTYLGPDFTAVPTPEPSTWFLLGLGLLAIAAFGRRFLGSGATPPVTET